MIADLVLEETIDRNGHDLLYIGSARQYRADCQLGQFKIGASQLVGHTLVLEVIAARITEGEFFGYPRQKWLNLIFADSQGIVSTVLFKTESMDNFLELHRRTYAAGETLLGFRIEARMSKRVSRDNGQGYYAAEFNVAGEGAYGRAITQFRQETALDGIYRAMAEPENTAQPASLPAA